MPDSDDEYVGSDSGDESHVVARGAGKPSTHPPGASKHGGRGNWEVARTWENVVEGEDGTISSTVDGLLEAGKRQRLLKDTTPLQRGIIRHLILVLDLSMTTAEKDLRPSRYLLSIKFAQEFVQEYFEQNPISQLGVIGLRDGLAVRISDPSGNPNDHVEALQKLRALEPSGDASLQNALEMARGLLYHTPTHATREVLIIFSALLSADPSNINTTITACTSAKITVSIIGLAAQLAICRTLVTKTNPGLNPDDLYGVALNEQHFRDLFMRATIPPVKAGKAPSSRKAGTANGKAPADDDDDDDDKASLLKMGFPSRIADPLPSFCACHSRPTTGGYLCSNCKSKVCTLPATCPVCGLTLILSTHLARSYHHLFPLVNWDTVSWRRAAQEPGQRACHSCMTPFPEVPRKGKAARASALAVAQGASESGRYACPHCRRFYCVDCDYFAHEVLHNCAGCLTGWGAVEGEGEDGGECVNGDGRERGKGKEDGKGKGKEKEKENGTGNEGADAMDTA